MIGRNFITVISACSVGIGAYLGAKYERWKTNTPSEYSSWTSVHASSSVPVNLPDNLSSNTALVMKYGFPTLENIRTFDDFVLAYDRRNRNAHWVFEHLNADKLPHKGSADRKYSNFYEDETIHDKFRSRLRDYKKSGYDRGHLAAAGNHRHNQRSMDQTFTLSNISPQVGQGFNRGIWNDLEQYVRSIARKNRNTYVCTGPLYLPRRENDGKLYVKYEVIGDNHVAVPTHFFKVLAIESPSGDFEIASFLLPNEMVKAGTPLHTFFTPPDTIERAAGFLLFDRLPKNRVKIINGVKH